jgi:hypothetical protein
MQPGHPASHVRASLKLRATLPWRKRFRQARKLLRRSRPPFNAQERSDGTLRFLALAGALLAYRLPPFMALNAPEASLPPDLMEPLARLVVQTAARTQVWLVAHSTRLAEAVTATGVGEVEPYRDRGARAICAAQPLPKPPRRRPGTLS